MSCVRSWRVGSLPSPFLFHLSNRACFAISCFLRKSSRSPLISSSLFDAATVLLTVSRVKLSPNMFEVDSKSTIDKAFKVKEALVWSVARKVMHPRNPETVALTHCTIGHGVYARPFAEIDQDDNGTVIKSEVKFWRNMFYVEFTEANTKKGLAEQTNQYRNLVVAIGKDAGDSWNTGRTYEVKNLRDWLEVDIDTLIQANQMGVLTSDYGGHVKFLKDQEQKRKQLEAEVADYTGKCKK